MSSAFSSSRRHEPSAKTWWSFPSKDPSAGPSTSQGLRDVSQKASRQSPKSGPLKFNTFASAIGFKSKKQPSLTIQDPPIHSRPVQSPQRTTNRVSAKSVSSVRSPAESLPPRTPMDDHRSGRQSVLTLSDADPFAARSISVPQTPDAVSLSLYSNASSPDFVASKHPDASIYNRVSYASSSSQSHSYNHDLSPLQPVAPAMPPSDVPRARLHSKRSMGNLHPKQALRESDDLLAALEDLAVGKDAPISVTSSRSRSNSVRQDSISSPVPHATETFTKHGLSRRPTKVVPARSPTNQSSLASPSHVILRQASLSRIGSPPSAPPRQELPPPPVIEFHARDDNSEVVGKSTASTSSSSLSFASSVSSRREAQSSQLFTSASSAPSRTLKKALSQQSLVKRGPQRPSSPSQAQTADRIPWKLKPAHHPTPPVPSNSVHFQTSPTTSSSPLVEQRRGSAGAIPPTGRKRLFSGSSLRRPSTSQCIVSAEEDTRSIFSVRSDFEMAPSILAPLSPSASSTFWDEPLPSNSTQPASHEYTPQQIMSPAEMAEVEASFERSQRKDVFSLNSTVAKPVEQESPVERPKALPNMPSRSSSVTAKGLSPPPRSSLRPATSQGNVTVSLNQRASGPLPMITSLPPPPRPRPRPSSANEAGEHVSSLPPPPRRAIHGHTSVEKTFNRRSIMKKPSFLEIDDDSDETDVDDSGTPLNASFLDLARESFDTDRSIID